MRKLFAILGVVFFTASMLLPWQASAQAPQKMSYQAVIRNSSDALIPNTQVGVKISILQGSATGTSVYTETQTPTTNANGLISLEIGGGTGFNSIDWSTGNYYIKTETDPTGGTNYSITGASQLLSVPYALHAKTAEIYTGTITETDPIFAAWDKSTDISITESQISDLGTYIETETDPIFAASPANGITLTNIGNWNTAFGWGDHLGLYRAASWVPTWTDITGTPTLFDGAWTSLTGKPTTISGYGITDAFSGSYNDLSNKPTLFDGAWTSLTGKPTTISGYGITDAFSGNYNDLTNKPTLFDGTWTSLTGKPSFATVATSGSYNDLSNKPTIPATADGSETKINAGTNVTITGVGTTTNPYILGITKGTAAGQMQYWNGTAWVTVAPGLNGQILKYKNGVPTWTDGNINDLSIGDSYQGGIIAYFLVPGDSGYDSNVRHGLIAAKTDQSSSIQWHNGTSVTTGATGTAIGTGSANTTTIINVQGETYTNYAAGLARAYNGGGYSDWYLPSIDELSKLYSNKDEIGGFILQRYWSSSEASISGASLIYFANGTVSNAVNKGLTFVCVRAVRSF